MEFLPQIISTKGNQEDVTTTVVYTSAINKLIVGNNCPKCKE